MKFKEKLKKIIQESGKTQKALAREAGITEVTLSRWVKGQRTPRQEDFAKLARVLPVSIEMLKESDESNETDLEYWKKRANEAESRLQEISAGRLTDMDMQGLSAEEYLDRLREAMRFVVNFITQDKSPRQ